ncbi:MAG: LysM peptidoglycan-binding domain-containing protein, partial [Caldilineaceae bacterium]
MSRHACSAQARPHPRRTAAFIAAQLLLGLLLVALLLGLRGGRAAAQEAVGGYLVQPGDTLSVIAARYGVAVDELTALNGIGDPNLLRVGQVLLIPGATG